MIKHIVMWTLKDEAEGVTAAENAKKIKQMLEGLNGKIPGLKHLEVGLDIFQASPAWQVVLYSELESRDALQGYQQHPEHQRCVEFVKKVVVDRGVVDYEI
ncbi:Dabb family protein [Desulfonatronum thioautotrophicum]|uniref:Dabb family protein n=1 Tax=Desulfonatronum thioautotrophicum TaxID=617001 RepID=UPI0005EAD5DB|nr:Dabb family protein [Desulfonatronum thioautotrophicum]